MAKPPDILSIRDLAVEVAGRGAPRAVLDGLSLDVPRGRAVALVGESGSGKTLAALAVLGLLPRAARVKGGVVLFDGEDVLAAGEEHLRGLRGSRIGMVFQEPRSALNPLKRVGPQIGEVLRLHKGIGGSLAREQVLALMELVGIADPSRTYDTYPHQLSSGVLQRVLIATALACRPDLVIADEPTSALDATVQAQILDLLARLRRDLRMSMLLITHNVGVVAALADSVAVLLDGRVVEAGDVREILTAPRHPYTRSLLAAGGQGARRRRGRAAVERGSP
jgi:ABC-type microcin C transport system duplicated ATPase subunit YejF